VTTAETALPPSGRRPAGAIPLVVVLAATSITFAAGALVKAPCGSGAWQDGRQYRRLCYTDIVPLYGTEHLQGSRLPYLDTCPTSSTNQCDEYPVLTMYFMRVAAWIGHGYAGFFWTNAVLLGLLALAVATALYLAVGERSLYFAVAPTLLLSGLLNWDLLAVALAAWGTLAFLRDRDELSGALLGLGAVAKVYPALLVVPFALQRLRQRRAAGAVSLGVWAAAAYALVSVPFVLVARPAWLTFFRFNADRVADFDSLWYLACRPLHLGCSLSPHRIDQLSLVLFLALAAGIYWARRRVDPDFPRWTFGFPLIVAFVLANKVYSPQYGLWFLPWFPLALPNLPLFLAFELADVAVFVTRFSWFGRLGGLGGAPLGAYQLALVLRAAVLLACLAAWILTPPASPDTGGPRRRRGETGRSSRTADPTARGIP